MNNKTASTPMLLELDLNRTQRPGQYDVSFYWDDDVLISAGLNRINMAKGLSPLSPSLKASFKLNLISFTKHGDYAPRTYEGLFQAIRMALNDYPTSIFDRNWIAQAQTRPVFQVNKRPILRFFLYWQEHDSDIISQDALRLLKDTAAYRRGPRNVLSDDPKKSWLTDEEYEDLLSAVWENYDSGVSGIQVTLMRLLSMQYARRPIQIAHLKLGDVRDSDGSDSQGLIGPIIDFPGVKDFSAENDFRDSKFEPHPLADHLWDLCHVQRNEVKALYEYNLGFALTDDQLNKLPLFCMEKSIKQARQTIERHHQYNLCESLDSRLFHLRTLQVSQVLRWAENTPTCNYGALLPKPPISYRTNQEMVVNATRIRHTRARQLARKGVPQDVLSHWLGHTVERSLTAYYNDPAELARQLDEAMAPVLAPLAMAFAGTLIDSEDQALRASDPTSRLEFASAGVLNTVGRCGKHSFCATTSVPIPCYRCKHFEPLVDAPHYEVLEALVGRQIAEDHVLKIGGPRNLLIPIDLSADIRAVKNCIARCSARKAEREFTS
ncbi:site-specific integrase [Pseudomonas sp. CCNWLW23]|uniref:site-specific integrase n=1 Tax=Pseudomonas sp. CCNWLW23 TaxID=3126385 RepID=UPI003012C5D4